MDEELADNVHMQKIRAVKLPVKSVDNFSSRKVLSYALSLAVSMSCELKTEEGTTLNLTEFPTF